MLRAPPLDGTVRPVAPRERAPGRFATAAPPNMSTMEELYATISGSLGDGEGAA